MDQTPIDHSSSSTFQPQLSQPQQQQQQQSSSGNNKSVGLEESDNPFDKM